MLLGHAPSTGKVSVLGEKGVLCVCVCVCVYMCGEHNCMLIHLVVESL